MAINWKNAQTNEKKFWKNVYINDVKDDVYGKTTDQGWKSFALQVFNRHDLDKNYLNDKIVLDLGSGPGGIARGIQVLTEKNEINNCSIIAIDPLMDFYKKEIGILKENKYTKLLTNQGEHINLPDNSVDIIFSTNVLDHCENPDDVIKECFRVLKPGGLFYPSMHLAYDYLTLFSKFIKYFDTNHPHHFTIKQIEKKFNKNFFNHKVNYKFSIKHDQSEFNLYNIFKSKNKLRSIKRYLSNFVLYTCYFTLRK